MSFIKRAKDYTLRFILGPSSVPRGLFELEQYFRMHRSISFKYERSGDTIIAVSTNFRYGSIITSGKDQNELDKNIRDAILTSFEVPSSYAKEADIRRGDDVRDRQKEYVLA